MLLRIDLIEEGETTVVQVMGQLADEGVAELERTLQSVTSPRVVDLSHLRTVDAEGIKILRAIAAEGGALRNVSPYIQLLLNRET